MSTTVEQLIAGVTALEQGIRALEVRERPLALRGWRDDFLGTAFHEQYSTHVGNGTVTFVPGGEHGGVIMLSTNAVLGAWADMFLGTRADAYLTLDADYGWTMIWRMKVSSVAGNLRARAGARDNAANNYIAAGLWQDFGNNWVVVTRLGGGAINSVASTVVADTNWHVHRLGVTSGLVNYFVDGSLLVTTPVSVPIVPLTPWISAFVSAAVARDAYYDWWDVIPQVLS